MYSFKKYTHNGDFIAEIPQKFIKNIPVFHESMNSGQGELALELSENISEKFLKFGELVRIFYDGKLIYSGFVGRKEKNFSENNSIVFYLIGFIDILRNHQVYWLASYNSSIDKNNKDYINGNAKFFFKEMIEHLNGFSNNFVFDEEKITDLSGNYNKRFKGSFLDLLKFFQENYGMNYFLGADGVLKVGVQENHILLFNKDIFEIKIETEFGEVVNFAEYKAVYKILDREGIHDSVEYLSKKDDESIRKIGLRYKMFSDYYFGVVLAEKYEDFRVKAKKHISDILEKAKNPFLNIKLKIFDKKYFGVLKVLDTLTIKNFSEEIENKKIVKISYNESYMEVELENFNTLGKEILG